MSFGDRLQEVRRNNGLTQEQFAEALQVSRQGGQPVGIRPQLPGGG